MIRKEYGGRGDTAWWDKVNKEVDGSGSKTVRKLVILAALALAVGTAAELSFLVGGFFR